MKECFLDKILQPNALQTVLQPIFQVLPGAQRLHAVEALNRGPAGTNLESAGVLFEYVRRKRQEPVVDRACVRAVLEVASQLPQDVAITFNVHASTLGRDPQFAQFLMEAAAGKAIALSRLIVEIVEQSPSWHRPNLRAALDILRQHGVRIALDDLGSGHSNFRMLLDCHPDYVKVDSALVHGCADDYYRRTVLESILNLAHKLGAVAVAEGVEHFADLERVITMGFTLVQCYLLGAPMTAGELQECDWFPRRAGQVRSSYLETCASRRASPIKAHPRGPSLLQISS